MSGMDQDNETEDWTGGQDNLEAELLELKRELERKSQEIHQLVNEGKEAETKEWLKKFGEKLALFEAKAREICDRNKCLLKESKAKTERLGKECETKQRELDARNAFAKIADLILAELKRRLKLRSINCSFEV